MNCPKCGNEGEWQYFDQNEGVAGYFCPSCENYFNSQSLEPKAKEEL